MSFVPFPLFLSFVTIALLTSGLRETDVNLDLDIRAQESDQAQAIPTIDCTLSDVNKQAFAKALRKKASNLPLRDDEELDQQSRRNWKFVRGTGRNTGGPCLLIPKVTIDDLKWALKTRGCCLDEDGEEVADIDDCETYPLLRQIIYKFNGGQGTAAAADAHPADTGPNGDTGDHAGAMRAIHVNWSPKVGGQKCYLPGSRKRVKDVEIIRKGKTEKVTQEYCSPYTQQHLARVADTWGNYVKQNKDGYKFKLATGYQEFTIRSNTKDTDDHTLFFEGRAVIDYMGNNAGTGNRKFFWSPWHYQSWNLDSGETVDKPACDGRDPSPWFEITGIPAPGAGTDYITDDELPDDF